MSNQATLPETTVRPRTSPREETRTRRVPPFHVILENDDHHSFEFVVDTLRKALGYTAERAMQLTMLAHRDGRTAVWTGPKEVAELKADQIQTFHEIRPTDGKQLGPLGCRIEPAVG